MADNNLIAKIRSSYNRLTKLERRVADFVLENAKEVVELTISDLAEQCGVGDTTVFRFCRSLNLAGYQDFKLSMALSTHSHQMLDSKPDINVAESGDLRELSHRIAMVYTNIISESLALLDYEGVCRTVDAMLGAQNIYLFGFGSSGIAALQMQNKFLRLVPNIIFVSDAHMQLTLSALLRPQDVAIIFCNSGATKDCIKIAKMSKAANAFTIFITKFAKTPAAEFSNVVLLCGAQEGPMQGGSISAFTSQLFMVDILYAELFRQMDETAQRNKTKTSQAIADKML